MESPAEFASFVAYTIGWRSVRWMPEKTAYATFNRVADQLWARQGAGVRQLQRNLSRVVPGADRDELRELSRQGMRSYMRYWCDVFRLPDWSHERILDTFVLHGREKMDAALAQGKGAVAVLPHAGNWDHAGAFASLTYHNLVSVAEDLRPRRLTDKFLEFRESLGMEIITLRAGDDVFGQLVGCIDQGKLIALLGDRDLTSSGVPVQFFGEATRMPAGPAALSHATGTPLLPVTLWIEDGRTHAFLGDAIYADQSAERADAVRATTQLIADDLAAGIRAHPTDWHMLQRLWLADLDQSRLRASRYDAPAGDSGDGRPWASGGA